MEKTITSLRLLDSTLLGTNVKDEKKMAPTFMVPSSPKLRCNADCPLADEHRLVGDQLRPLECPAKRLAVLRALREVSRSVSKASQPRLDRLQTS